ncbi:hypothetical protein BC628DRAFT_1014738 [Trametes gibbosa]|nr:hypothetical protein BC628DRAFT_1014738 [Trametes gibbosa]
MDGKLPRSPCRASSNFKAPRWVLVGSVVGARAGLGLWMVPAQDDARWTRLLSNTILISTGRSSYSLLSSIPTVSCPLLSIAECSLSADARNRMDSFSSSYAVKITEKAHEDRKANQRPSLFRDFWALQNSVSQPVCDRCELHPSYIHHFAFRP